MEEIIKMDGTDIISTDQTGSEVAEMAEKMLADVRTDLTLRGSISMPIAELSTLGAGVSSLIPTLNTVTQTTTIDMQGLYRVANAAPGDVLKLAKNGNWWGALKTADGSSKMAQLTQAGSVTATTNTVAAINPASMMMAVALFSIEQKLGSIEDMQKQMLQNMEFDKQSKIEGDVDQLLSIIKKYKHNWDSDVFIAGNYKMVNDIQRTAREHMHAYQKRVNSILDSKKPVVVHAQVKSKLHELLTEFKYYRLSLYMFAMASLLEIMLSGNFIEEYITGIRTEIEKMVGDYRDAFDKCSRFLEKISDSSIETNVLRGLGSASKFTGKIIGSIPVIEKGPVDEFLLDSGNKMKKNAHGIEQDVVRAFAKISNPGTYVFTEKMNDLIGIYNHTAEICVDNKRIYLLRNE